MDWFDASGRIEALSCVDALWAHCLETFAAAGFGAVVYLSSNADRSAVTLRTNIPELYEGLPPERDPFLEYCCNSYEVTRAGPDFLPRHDYLSEQEKAFVAKASALGFFTGFAIPVRLSGSPSYGGFILGSSLRAEAFEAKHAHELDALRAHCLVLHRRLEELGSAALYDVLSPRERDVIRLAIDGAARKEIARALSLSPNTIAEYTKSAYRKLGVRSKVEAARKLAR